MGAVASFVEDVVEGVGDVVGGVAEGIGDVVESVADFAGDVVGGVDDAFNDIFGSVGDAFESVGDFVEDAFDWCGDVFEKVGDVVQTVLDDPLPVLVAVAGQAIGIPAPVTMGALTAARGGDLEDIALSMGTAYFAPTIGSTISSTVSSSFIEAGLNETFSQVASNAISSGLVNGTVAEIKGGSFDDGFAGGFTGGMVAGGVREVGNYVKPDIIAMAQDSGLDLQDANALYNATTKAFSAGITSEVTGRGDFTTSFTNSAIGSGVDYGVREVNQTIDQQFRTAATDWNEKDKQGEPVEVAITGAGIPNEVVGQVQVSDIGVLNDAETINTSSGEKATSDISVDNDAGTFDVASVLADSQATTDVNNASSSYTGEKATSDISILPETQLAEAPQAETIYDFADTIGAEKPVFGETVLVENTDVPESVIDIAEDLPEEAPLVASTEPVGGLSALADATTPAIDLDTSQPAVVSEAPVAENLVTSGLAADQPVGGLNAVAQADQATPEAKMASSMGLKATDFTKPMVATVGNLLKQSLTQKKPPVRRAPAPRPVGGLQTARARPASTKAPPARMDIANLIPIQKAAPLQTAKLPPSAPAKRLDKNAKLTPITNIASLTSQVKKAG